jgi:hypothetical protein
MAKDHGNPRPLWTKCRLPKDYGNIHEIPPDRSSKCRPPIDFNNDNNMAGIIISNIILEENNAK